MPTGAAVETSIEAGLGRITINRPHKGNALDRATVADLTTALQQCQKDRAVRLVQISAAGDVFSAGADVAEMRAMLEAPEASHLADATRLATLLTLVDGFPKPTVARVNGDCYGGALGLLAACDVVLACAEAKFAFTDARLGLTPAVIAPFVLAKMGESAARRYFLTGETLTAERLKELHLVHEVVPLAELDAMCAGTVRALLEAAPGALTATKQLIRDVSRSTEDRAKLVSELAKKLAHARLQPEAKEGIAAFLGERKAGWASLP